MRKLVTTVSPALLTALFIIFGLYASSLGEDKPTDYQPKVLPASSEATQAINKFRVPAGLQLDLFAAEPHLANPVAFCLDERGRAYVVETFRLHAGVTDIRGHMNWLDDDLACRTVDDRVALYRKYLKEKFSTYGVEHDRIRLVEDTDGDGKSDKATVFADAFNAPAEGLAAGVLARNGKVWVTCIPNLWLLEDTDGDGKADVRKVLHTGFGVHVGFIGHDMHGLRFGPDGKLYFSIGDRGFNVTTKEGKHLFYPDTGAVLRCNPDGSDLEVIHIGLRNPQELAFDQYGNLFTGDNNSDGGDKARWVQIVEGGDSGWRCGYQYIERPVARGPWNAEKMWHPQWDGQAAYLVPPLLNLADGPSGLTYYPGVGLPERYREHFFLADFRGGSGNSGIRSFALKPKGASFEVVDSHEFLWSILATDVDFGPDCGLYVSDWVEGWGLTGKGRLYKLTDPTQQKAAKEVGQFLTEGMSKRVVPELIHLLAHADQRVRQAAQFELAERGESVKPLQDLALKSQHQLARIHALWALGQIERRRSGGLAPLAGLLKDHDAEIRAQTVKLLGDHGMADAGLDAVALSRDDSPRVRFCAALAVGKLVAKSPALRSKVVDSVIEMLRENADKDPYLRHAGVMALVQVNSKEALDAASRDSSAAVRSAALLALRRLGSPDIVRFLDDGEPRLVVEAARAINDVPIEAAQPALAKMIQRTGLSEPVYLRGINANFRLGQAEDAARVAALAARSDAPERVRLEALGALADWAKPSGRDRVTGLWRPLAARESLNVADVVKPHLGGIFSGSDKVRQLGTKLAADLGIKEIGPTLFALVRDKHNAPQTRAEALAALDTLKDARLEEAMKLARTDDDPRVRTAGRRVLARLHPADAVAECGEVLSNGSISEQQGALAILGSLKDDGVDKLLEQATDRLLAKQLPAELQLDVLEAVAARQSPALSTKLQQHDTTRVKDDPLAVYRECQSGGDVDNGRRIFFHKAEVYCLRCHKVQGEGGEVGPDLSKIGGQQKRDYLLEALVEPNRQIAKGFETQMLLLKDGRIVSGIVKGEDAQAIRLLTPESQLITIRRDDIDDQKRGPSSMPQDLVKHLSKRELRDVIEFLAGLK